MLLRFSDPSLTCWLGHFCDDAPFYKIDIEEEVARILSDKPHTLLPEVKGEATIKALHVSDIHYDRDYIVGAPVKCNDILCCRKMDSPEDNLPEDTERAGEYGAVGDCDIPWKTVLSLF